MTDGALLLDKPVGLTSNFALQRTKKLLGARKAGHAGTLDPLASGLLVVLFGEATKLAGVLLGADKEYAATVKLGERTSTGDAEGLVIERKEAQLSQGEISAVLERFRGPIQQLPPMHSALKYDGTPLYKLARRGESIERQSRPVVVSELVLVEYRLPYLELRVRCSKGTYIRVLAEDIGSALGSCAHLAALRRTGSGSFSLRDAISLEELEGMEPARRAGRVIPFAALLGEFPRAELDDAAQARFRNGQALQLGGLAEGLCAVYGARGEVIGLGFADGAGGLRPVRLTASQAAEKHRKTL
jgi:tRNA pseudouridine55 synthase